MVVREFRTEDRIAGVSGILLESVRFYEDSSFLCFVDITEGILFYQHHGGKLEKKSFPFLIGCVNRVEANVLLMCTSIGIVSYILSDESWSVVARIPDTGVRFNDGFIDSYGNLWAGTMGHPKVIDGKGKLYFYNSNRLNWDNPIVVHNGVTISNGLCVDLSKEELLYVDTPTRTLTYNRIDSSRGIIKDTRVLVDFTFRGLPDGICKDLDNNVWVAEWGSGVVSVWSNRGELLGEWRLPEKNVTSVAVTREYIYVTTAAGEEDEFGYLYKTILN